MVAQLRLVVSVGAKSHKAFCIEVQLHRPHLRYGDVDSHVPFQTSYEQRIRDIFLKYTLLIIIQIIHIINDCDTSTTAEVGWLANPQAALVAFLIEVLDKLFVFIWQNKCQWSEIKHFAV